MAVVLGDRPEGEAQLCLGLLLAAERGVAWTDQKRR